MVVERIGQFGVYPQRSNFREHSVCTNSVSNFRCSSVDEHIPVSPVVTDTVHPTRSADSQEFCRSVMENSEPGASRSDLGLGIIDTACLFCVAGSDWWANCKSLLEDFGLKHEIDETREAERYKFGDGGTLVSSIRVTAPVFVAGKKGRIVFSVVPSKQLPLLIGRDFLTLARAVVDMGEKTLRIGTGVDDLVVSRAGQLALRLNPQDWHREANLIEDIPVRLRVRRKRQDPRTEKLLQSIATVLIIHVVFPQRVCKKSSRSCLKNVAQLPHFDEHPRHCLVCSVPFDRGDCSHKTLCTRCVFNVDDKNSCSNASSSLVESDCVSIEVNIVEEEQNM